MRILNGEIKRYVMGNSFYTGMFKEIEKLSINDIEDMDFKVVDELSTLSLIMRDEDIIFGLGENVRGLNKRGFIYESFCSDDPNHAEDKKSLYRCWPIFS